MALCDICALTEFVWSTWGGVPHMLKQRTWGKNSGWKSHLNCLPLSACMIYYTHLLLPTWYWLNLIPPVHDRLLLSNFAYSNVTRFQPREQCKHFKMLSCISLTLLWHWFKLSVSSCFSFCSITWRGYCCTALPAMARLTSSGGPNSLLCSTWNAALYGDLIKSTLED